MHSTIYHHTDINIYKNKTAYMISKFGMTMNSMHQ